MTERLYFRLEGDPLHPPETTVPTGTMTEFAVRERLREHVSHIAAYRESFPEDKTVLERILPDGAVRLMFNVGDAPSNEREPGSPLQVAGASANPVVLRLRGRIAGISVTLRPGSAFAVLGVPAASLAERSLELETLWRSEADEILARLTEAWPDEGACSAIVQTALERRVSDDDRAARRLARRAAASFVESGGRHSLGQVARALGVGERRVQQLFQTHVGLSPRTYRRLARLHACLRALRGPSMPKWAEVAVGAGFYDQSHLIHEFRSLCGLTPSDFMRVVAAAKSEDPEAISRSSKRLDRPPSMLGP